MGDTYREWVLPYALAEGTLPHFAPGIEYPGGITPEVLADRGWLIGDPDTVAAGVALLHEETGGFGTLLATVYDYADDPEPYRRSLQLLAKEVVPRVERLVGADRIAATASHPDDRRSTSCRPRRVRAAGLRPRCRRGA